MTIEAYERKREQARQARQEATELRELYEIATCGLGMRYRHNHDHTERQVINHGIYEVPTRIALRVADQYPIWAAEYDAIAEQIEAEMSAMLA